MYKVKIYKHLLSFFLLLILNNTASAQKWAWLTGGGSHWNQNINSVTSDYSGNIYVTGYVNDSLIIQTAKLVMKGNGMFLAKFNPQGQVVYLKGFGSGSYTFGTQIVYDKKGFLYITGKYYGGKITFGTLSLTNKLPSYDMGFIAKTDLNGTGIWAANIDNTGNPFPVRLKYNENDSTLAIGGTFRSNMFHFGNDSLKGTGSQDIFLCTFNSVTGKPKWIDAGGTKSVDYFDAIEFDKSGNICVAFTIQRITAADSFKSKNLKIPCTYGYDAILVKYGKKGNVIWENYLNGGYDQFIRGMKYGKDDCIYLGTYCGGSSNMFGITYNPSPGYASSLVKLDSAGKFLKKKDIFSYVGATYEIYEDTLGYMYIAGENNFKIDKLNIFISSSENFYIIKMDTSLYCSQGIAGGNNITGLCTYVTQKGDCIIGGSFELPKDSFFKVAKFKTKSKGDQDVFLCKWNFNDVCYKPQSLLRYVKNNKTYTFMDSGKIFSDQRWWYFGDGKSDTSKNPVHTYVNSGIYNVKLISENQCGRDTVIQTLYVDCTIKPKYGYKVTGRKVQFSDSSSNNTSRIWYFGDGQTDTSKNPLHWFTNNGNYNVKLELKGLCLKDSIVKTIIIDCNLPVVGFYFVDTNRNVRFIDTTFGSLKRIWNFGDGETETSIIFNHTYFANGTYLVKLVSENICGKDSISKMITIKCPKPEIDFSYIIRSDTVFFYCTSKNFQVYNWRYTFGDGYTTFAKNISHKYASKGAYNVILNAENQCGKDTAIKNIDLNCVPKSKLFYKIIGSKVAFADSSKFGNSRKWYFGDGKTDTIFNPEHQYSDSGTFLVKLVSFGKCGKDSILQSIYIYCKKPIGNFLHSFSGLKVYFSNTSLRSNKQLWEFGDGFSDTSKNPIYIYNNEGNYTVTLIPENACGKDTFFKTILLKSNSFKKNDSYYFSISYVSSGRYLYTANSELSQFTTEIEFFNINGKTILKQFLNKGESKAIIELQTPPPGIYFFKITNENIRHPIKKIIIY